MSNVLTSRIDHPLAHQAFEFTSENELAAESHINKYPPGRQASAVLPLLDLAQRQCGGWLPQPAMEAVANILKMPFIRVHEVATFYTMFNLAPVGQHHIQLCRTTPCWLRGSNQIQEICESHLGIKPGQVTPDGKFSMIEVECIGACVNAPVVQINDHYYEDLTPEAMSMILEDLANNKSVRHPIKSSSMDQDPFPAGSKVKETKNTEGKER